MYIIFIHFFPSSCDKESMLQILRVCEGGWKCSHFFVWDWEKKRAVFQMSAKWNEFVSVCEREWKLPNMIRVSGGKSSNFRKWRTKSHIPEFDVWERRKCAPDYTGRVGGRGRLFQSDYCLGTRQASLPPNSARFSYATEGVLFISAQLSTDAVSALRKVRVLTRVHTPSIAFRHLPPNSARFIYATEGALYPRVAVQRRGERPPRGLGTDMTVEVT